MENGRSLRRESANTLRLIDFVACVADVVLIILLSTDVDEEKKEA